jgi:hypothetical protein
LHHQGNAGGDLAGTYPIQHSQQESVNTTKIADASVTNAKIVMQLLLRLN